MRSKRRIDLALGIAVGIVLGVAIVAIFVFVFSEETVDSPQLDEAAPLERRSDD